MLFLPSSFHSGLSGGPSGVAACLVSVLALAGCADPGDKDGPVTDDRAVLDDFLACPWTGAEGVPDNCTNDVPVIAPNSPPTVVGPCIERSLPDGPVTVIVHRDLEGLTFELAHAGPGNWTAILVIGGDPSAAYAMSVGPDVQWFTLPDVPQDGQLRILFLTYNVASEPPDFTQGHEVRWVEQGGIYRPLLVTTGDDGVQHHFDIGLFAVGTPPFPLLPTNLELLGADFALHLNQVDNDLFGGQVNSQNPGDPGCITVNP